MKRPERLRILGKQVTVQYVPAGDALLRDGPDDASPGVGRSDGGKQSMAVEAGQPLASEQDTVLHETLHIIEEYMGMNVPEEVVAKFATGLLAVIKDNPRFVSYLRQKEPK